MRSVATDSAKLFLRTNITGGARMLMARIIAILLVFEQTTVAGEEEIIGSDKRIMN